MEIWPALVMEIRAPETEPLVKATQQARSPEVAVARHLGSENQLALGKPEQDSGEPLAAWQSARLAQAFFAPAQQWSVPWRG
jgi:hypothetical protein